MKKAGLVYELIEKEKKERTGKLDIGKCGLTRLPEELFELEWLEELIISNGFWNYDTGDWIESPRRGALNRLGDISTSIYHLNNLKKLHISGDSGDSWPINGIQLLGNLTGLRELYLSASQFTKYDFFEKLTCLEVLDLSFNPINDTHFIEKLSKIKTLYLRNVQVSNYNFLAKFPGINTLDLSFNHIEELYFLEKLTEIQNLNLRYNQIKDISVLEKLKKLKTLILSSNQIKDISVLEKLKMLNNLYLSNNIISDYHQLENLIWIESLTLRSNQISNLHFLEKLTALKTLHLSSNEISDLYFIEKLHNLRTLELSYNRINDISYLEKLTNLKTLDVRFNQINDISVLKTLLIEKGLDISLNEYGSGILLRNNPITIPPPEILKRGRAAVVDYFEKLEKEKVRLFESKMLFVGQGEVGKTWLLHRLITGKTPEEGETTEGIDIKQWYFDRDEIENFRINLWDFGGQEIYHATHQFFLSKRSLYLFIWDARKEQDIVTSFDYWLNIISLLSNNAPIIVVMNKCDERTKAIEEETLKNKFNNIVGFHKVSAKDGTGIEYLKDDIQNHILNLPQVGNTLPKVWNDIRKELEQLDKHCISNTEYKGICLKYGLNAKDAEFIGDYYHDVGVFLHFRENHILNDILFLNPEWATNAVYKIIDTKEVANAFGKFQFSQLKTIWNEYDEDKFVYLIELMKLFELCFQLGSSENYIVPELLRPEFTDLKWDYSSNLRFEYNYTFMPAGIITRFITRQHRLIKDELYWRKGLVISKNSTEALIISEPLNRKIRIWIKGDEAMELLFLIRDEIEDIHETLNFPEVKQMYPCNCDKCSVSDNPHFFGSDMLVNFRLKKIETAQCQTSGKMINIEELRGTVMSKTDIALESIMEIGSKNEDKLNEIVRLLETIKSNLPEKETALDDFFKMVPLDLQLVNVGEVLKRLLKYKERKFI